MGHRLNPKYSYKYWLAGRFCALIQAIQRFLVFLRNKKSFVYIPSFNVERLIMNKAELVEKIAKDADISKASAERVLNTSIETIIKAVTKGDKVQLIGFGTFGSGKRAARVGRNPKTGEAIKIAAAKTVKFTAGKAFKDAVNKRK